MCYDDATAQWIDRDWLGWGGGPPRGWSGHHAKLWERSVSEQGQCRHDSLQVGMNSVHLENRNKAMWLELRSREGERQEMLLRLAGWGLYTKQCWETIKQFPSDSWHHLILIFLKGDSGFFRTARLAPRASAKEPWQPLGRRHWGLALDVGGEVGRFARGFGVNSVGLADESDVRREKEAIRVALGRWATMTGKCHFLGWRSLREKLV